MERGLDDVSLKVKHWLQGGLILDIIVGKSVAICQLFASKYQMLLVSQDVLFVLDFGFDTLEGDGFALQGLHKDLHLCVCRAAPPPCLKVKKVLRRDCMSARRYSTLV